MNILEQIIEVKKQEVAASRKIVSLQELEKAPAFTRQARSVVNIYNSKRTTGIIAEFKKASPSKGIINDRTPIEEVVQAYARHGVAAISVLTDQQFFKGSLNDLKRARMAVQGTPLLRKDFIIDEYQVAEAKVAGADLLLLIAACLSPERVRELARYAKSAGLEVLLEIHNEQELVHLCDEVDLVGVNNRDLKTFQVDMEHSIRLASLIPPGKIRIAESGIHSVETVQHLSSSGFDGFLIGELFMKQEDPGAAFKSFTDELKRLPA
jgi:indole-3-glycerol phosphate synthase